MNASSRRRTTLSSGVVPAPALPATAGAHATLLCSQPNSCMAVSDTHNKVWLLVLHRQGHRLPAHIVGHRRDHCHCLRTCHQPYRKLGGCCRFCAKPQDPRRPQRHQAKAGAAGHRGGRQLKQHCWRRRQPPGTRGIVGKLRRRNGIATLTDTVGTDWGSPGPARDLHSSPGFRAGLLAAFSFALRSDTAQHSAALCLRALERHCALKIDHR